MHVKDNGPSFFFSRVIKQKESFQTVTNIAKKTKPVIFTLLTFTSVDIFWGLIPICNMQCAVCSVHCAAFSD